MQLKEYIFGKEAKKPGSLWQLLMALKECGLKNDAMPDLFYEEFGQRYKAAGSFGVYLFHGSYDVPLRPATGKAFGNPWRFTRSLPGKRGLRAGRAGERFSLSLL